MGSSKRHVLDFWLCIQHNFSTLIYSNFSAYENTSHTIHFCFRQKIVLFPKYGLHCYVMHPMYYGFDRPLLLRALFFFWYGKQANDSTCLAAVHGDHYVTGTFPGAGIGWVSMEINNDCYVTITVDHGSTGTINESIKPYDYSFRLYCFNTGNRRTFHLLNKTISE